MTIEMVSDCVGVRYGTPDRVVVMFSSFMAVPRRQFDYTRFAEDIPYTLLFVRDNNVHNGYHAGFPGVSESIEESVEFLQYFTGRLGADRLTMFGTSLGGYAAQLFGYLVGADDILTIGPSFYMDPTLRDAKGGERIAGLMDHYANVYRSRGEEPRNLDLRPLIEANADKVGANKVYYSPDDVNDALHIAHMDGVPGINIVPVPGSDHRYLGVQLMRDGTLISDLAKPVDALKTETQGAAVA